MFLQATPAETFEFMIYGFTVILGSIALFTLSIFIRFRNLGRDVQLLEDLATDE